MKTSLLILTTLIALIVMEIVYITAQNDLAEQNAILGNMQNKIQQLQKANLELRAEVLYYSSYNYIRQEATNRGFIPAQNVIFLH